jgi:hypothetical protein
VAVVIADNAGGEKSPQGELPMLMGGVSGDLEETAEVKQDSGGAVGGEDDITVPSVAVSAAGGRTLRKALRVSDAE